MGETPLLKICGLTNIADWRTAQAAGADYLGLVIEAPRPRSVTMEVAARLAALAPQQAVAVTLNQDPVFLRRVVRELRPRALQLHGPGAALLAADYAPLCPVWVAVGLPPAGRPQADSLGRVLQTVQQAVVGGAEMIVLDTSIKGQSGGTGQACDWTLAAAVVAQCSLPILLAGGIGPDNAAEALAQVHPAGLDASSRLELYFGKKDPLKVRALGQVVKGLPHE